MMKRILLIILSVLFIISVCSIAEAADATFIESGDGVIISDENWSYEKIKTYGWKIVKYIGVDSTIGNYAFNGCSSVNTITLYDSLTTLGIGCFYGCSSLSNINLDESSVSSIPAYCFAECGITDVELPVTRTSIGNLAFNNCSLLTKIVIPNSVTEIHHDAFNGSENVVIYCYTDSAAHQYAVANNIPFVLLDAEPEGYLLGDTDNNDDVEVIDATWLQRYVAFMDIGVIVGISTPYDIGEIVTDN